VASLRGLRKKWMLREYEKVTSARSSRNQWIARRVISFRR
jgi:hypothetical protein